MNSIRNKIRLSVIFIFVLSLFGVLLRILASFLQYDKEIGYFQTGAPLPVILIGVSIITLPAVLFFALFFRKKLFFPEVRNAMKEKNLPLLISSLFSAVLFFGTFLTEFYFFYTEKMAGANVSLRGFALLFHFAAIGFFLVWFLKNRRATAVHVYFGFALLLFCISILSYAYFDSKTPMNNPNKIFLQLSMIGALFFLLSDLRYFLDTEKPSIFLASSLLSVYFLSVSSIPGILLYLFGILRNADYFVYDVCGFALLLYTVVRLIGFARAVPADPLPQPLSEPESDSVEQPSPLDEPLEPIGSDNPENGGETESDPVKEETPAEESDRTGETQA